MHSVIEMLFCIMLFFVMSFQCYFVICQFLEICCAFMLCSPG